VGSPAIAETSANSRPCSNNRKSQQQQGSQQSRGANNSSEANNSSDVRKVGNTSSRRELKGIGKATTAESLAIAGNPGKKQQR
jgi:hypothetical protein